MSERDDNEFDWDNFGSLSSSTCYLIDSDQNRKEEESDGDEALAEENHCTENETAPLDDATFQERRDYLYRVLHWTKQAQRASENEHSQLTSLLETVERNYRELQKQMTHVTNRCVRLEKERDALLAQTQQQKKIETVEPITPSLVEEKSFQGVMVPAVDEKSPRQSNSKKRLFDEPDDTPESPGITVEKHRRRRIPNKKYIDS